MTLRHAILYVSFLFLTACSGSDSGSSSVNGVASKGPITGATIIATTVDGNELARTVTDSEGLYSLDLDDIQENELIIIHSTGGTYTDEATVTANMPAPKLTVVSRISLDNENQIAITPLTELAYSLANEDGDLSDIAQHNKAIAGQFGLGDINIVSTQPKDLSKETAKSDPESYYGTVLASLSQLQKDNATLTSSADVIATLKADIKTNEGKLYNRTAALRAAISQAVANPNIKTMATVSSSLKEGIGNTAVAIDSIALPATVNIAVAATSQLTAKILPANAQASTTTWRSSDKTIAMVSQKGLVTAVSKGTATITVTTANNKTAQTAITVASSNDKAEEKAPEKKTPVTKTPDNKPKTSPPTSDITPATVNVAVIQNTAFSQQLFTKLRKEPIVSCSSDAPLETGLTLEVVANKTSCQLSGTATHDFSSSYAITAHYEKGTETAKIVVVSQQQSTTQLGQLHVPLTVKEVAGVGANNYPVKVVIPLPKGQYQTLTDFRIVDQSGNTIPAQFEVHNRWWATDNSLRHIVAHFQTQVSAFTTENTGQAHYWLNDTGGNIAPASAVTINEGASKLVVNTGATTLTINRAPFSIETAKGMLQPELQFWDRVQNKAILQQSFDRSDISIEVEENGPIRSVIKVSAPTIYNAVNDHTHGWAIRLYAYAGQPFVKIDYQLQNSANNAVLSAPLYFKSMSLTLETGDVTTAQQVKSVVVTKAEHLDLRGAVSTGSTQAIIRNFTQMWPNGLGVASNGKLTIELWPEWGEKIYWQKEKNAAGKAVSVLHHADKYWLDDMQHVYKEVLLNFGAMDAAQLSQLADTFQYPPVVSLPVSWYADTKVTLSMGGVVPYREKISTKDLRLPHYTGNRDMHLEINNGGRYKFGWNSFAGDVHRRTATNMPGGIAYSRNAFIVTENPANYYKDLDFAIGELNMRPQWLAGYKHEQDQARLELTTNPYGGQSWRHFKGHGAPTLDAGYLVGSKRHSHPRDDQHGWFYHVEDAYNLSANLWIKDWYGFVGEFRKTFLNHPDPKSSRGQAHALSHALAAYRATGDVEILTTARDSFVHTTLKKSLYPATKVKTSSSSTESSFQLGYLSYSLIDLYIELGGDQTTLDILAGFMDWNLNLCNFCYYVDVTKTGYLEDVFKVDKKTGVKHYSVINGEGVSNGTGVTLIDPQLWVAQKLGRTDLIDQINTYVDSGINTGRRPFSAKEATHWNGSYIGRLYTDYLLNVKQ